MTRNPTAALKDELAAIQHWESTIRALVDWDPSASLKRLEESGDGPLGGWPIGVKDIINVRGMRTRCNVDFLPANPAPENAAVVETLMNLGAFVLAKTVTTSFAFLDPGVTRNPWNSNHTPGGSSSGSAAAVACGMVRLALGSQTVASVNRPASYCGVVGFKPTFGRLSTSGIFPFAPSVDTVGFFTRGVSDMQTAGSVLFREPVEPPATSLKIGLVKDLWTASAEEEMLTALKNSGERLATAGCTVRPLTLPSESAEAYGHHFSLIAAEATQVHEKLFPQHGELYPPKIRELLVGGQGVTSEGLEQIQAHRGSLRQSIVGLFEDVDVMLLPSAPGPAPVGLTRTGDPRFSLIWTYTGCPTLTLPVTLSRNALPIGLQLVGPPMKDMSLLSAGRAIESVLPFRSKPG